MKTDEHEGLNQEAGHEMRGGGGMSGAFSAPESITYVVFVISAVSQVHCGGNVE